MDETKDSHDLINYTLILIRVAIEKN